MVNDSIVLSDVVRYKNSLNKRIIELFGVDFSSVSKQKLLDFIGQGKETLHKRLKNLLKDETLSLSECLFVVMNYDGIIKPICKGCKRKLRFEELTDEFINKCDYCHTYNDLNQEFETIKNKQSPTVKVTANKIDDMSIILNDKSAYENMTPIDYTPRPATSGNASEIVIKKLCTDQYGHCDGVKIETNKFRSHKKMKNLKLSFDLLIEYLKLYIESHGAHFHDIDSETVKGRFDYHKMKRELAELLGCVCLQYTTSFASRRLNSICIIRNIERSILSNNNLPIELRLNISYGLRMEFKHLHDVTPIISDNIDYYNDFEFDTPICKEFRMNCPEGFINKSEYKIATLYFESNYTKEQHYPATIDKCAAMIQYRIVKGVAYIYKHYDYNNYIVNSEYNTLLMFANHFRKKYRVTAVKYIGNRDYEQPDNFKFFRMPINSKTTKRDYLENYRKYPIFTNITEGEPICFIKSLTDRKAKHNNECDAIEEYSFETDPDLSIPVTENNLKKLPGCITIINSGTFILDL
jgi:hypothetical protein